MFSISAADALVWLSMVQLSTSNSIQDKPIYLNTKFTENPALHSGKYGDSNVLSLLNH